MPGDAVGLHTRRQLLTRAGGAVALAGLGAGTLAAADRLYGGSSTGADRAADRALASFASRSTGQVTAFRSRPDLLAPVVASAGAGTAEDYLMIGPGSTDGFTHGPPRTGPQQGAMLVDREGELVWFNPLAGARWATNLRVQLYRGQPALTWWEGNVREVGFGQGEALIVDGSYRELARVHAGNGRVADLHEFVLTPEGTALITCYPETVRTDFSKRGGPRSGNVLGSIIQEIDVSSGRVLFEWRSLEHVAVTESYQLMEDPYDYFHANSIDVTPDGNLLVSARATWTVYKLDRRSGEVIWRLGGKRSDFKVDPAARFSWQHDARQLGDRLITLYDDGAGPGVATERQSRGLFLDVDTDRRTVALAREFRYPERLLSGAMGNVQELPNGHVLVGWGAQRFVTEFAADATPLAEASLTSGLFSYRAYRFPWTGIPHEAPALAAARDAASDRQILYASWNGATEVTHWRVDTGPSRDQLRPLGIARRQGFETAIPLGTNPGYAAVAALDASGRVLGVSPLIRV
jgi:Arylsulfotransferase (ASST)